MTEQDTTIESATRATEGQQLHTRILRVMLATEDSVGYWRASGREALELKDRVRTAYEERWFGAKSEARVKTLLGDMALRFDAYPNALQALHVWDPPRFLAPWLCHFHTQLADPIYRAFTGEYLPERRVAGYERVDRESVARWVNERWPERWSPITCLKFGSNLLATAAAAGLLKQRRDPRELQAPRAPKLAVEYLFYLLREVQIEHALLDSPYVKALAVTHAERAQLVHPLSGVRIHALGDVIEFTWVFPDLLSWALERKAAT